MAAELARAGGVLAAAGLAVVFVAPGRWPRLGGLGAWALGGATLLLYLEPFGELDKLAAAAVALGAAGAGLAALFLRWPWLVALSALAVAPARIPLDLGGERVNLLLPLYVVVAGAAIALAWRLPQDNGRSRELGPLAWPAAAFVAWVGLSLAWAEDLRNGAVDLAAFYLPFGLLALVLARLPWSRRWLVGLAAQLAVMALIFAGIGIYQWATRDVFWNPKVIVGNVYAPFFRVNSVFWDPSIYGRFLTLAVLMLLVLVLFGRGARFALAATAAIAVVWAGLFLSFSQSSFAALMAGLVAAGAIAWGRRAVIALGLVAVVLVSVGFSAPSVRTEIRNDLNRVTGGRSSLVANGARIAVDHPVGGVGLGSFERAYAERTGLRGEEPRRAASHNTPVTVAAETGAPGFALFLWLLVTALAVGFRRASHSFAGRASLIVALALLAIAVHSLFYNAFFEDPLAWGALGLAALVSSWRGEGR